MAKAPTRAEIEVVLTDLVKRIMAAEEVRIDMINETQIRPTDGPWIEREFTGWHEVHIAFYEPKV